MCQVLIYCFEKYKICLIMCIDFADSIWYTTKRNGGDFATRRKTFVTESVRLYGKDEVSKGEVRYAEYGELVARRKETLNEKAQSNYFFDLYADGTVFAMADFLAVRQSQFHCFGISRSANGRAHF